MQANVPNVLYGTTGTTFTANTINVQVTDPATGLVAPLAPARLSDREWLDAEVAAVCKSVA